MTLSDDPELLRQMMHDSTGTRDLYNPGSYWAKKAVKATEEILKHGISDFRGSSNIIGLSYADNVFIDVRKTYAGIKKLICYVISLFPFKSIFNAQVRLAENYARQNIVLLEHILKSNERTEYLLRKFKVPPSLIGGCLAKAKINGTEYSTHYLNLLDQHASHAKVINFRNVRTVFEIGGGFGANMHLLLSNYAKIRKVFYLDIAPNLYVGTQYLRHFFGDAVVSYAQLKERKRIHFSPNDELEIYCILPSQIELIDEKIDVFMNSHSFVEMPAAVVKNYAGHIMRQSGSKQTAIALTSYDHFESNSTLDPTTLPATFENRKFVQFESASLLEIGRKNLYFVSKGSHGVSAK